MKVFSSRQGKFHHKKFVKCKPSSDTNPTHCTIITNTDNSTTNNITNHHVTNNNNITIQLNVHGKENYDALLDAIQTKYSQAFINMVHDGDAASLLELVHFNADFPENQTIRKKVKKDLSAEVYVGDGKWERRPAVDVIETFRDQTTKRVCDPAMLATGTTASASASENDARTNRYLEEVLYVQTKHPKDAYGNTDSMLSPFEDADQLTSAEKKLLRNVYALRDQFKAEFPSLVGKPIFVRNWKKMAIPEIHAFEREWNTVVDTIDWSA